MKKKLLVIGMGLFLLLFSGTANAINLTNRAFTLADYLGSGFSGSVFGSVLDVPFDIGADLTVDGKVISLVTKSTIAGQDWYAYFYGIAMNEQTVTVGRALRGFSLNWGSVAPLSFDFDGGSASYLPTDNSWYGRTVDGWPAAFDGNPGNIPPEGASYDSDVIAWTYFISPLHRGDRTAWMMALSHNAPTVVPGNILDGGPAELFGDVYAPAVPEPATLLLLGFGLAGLGLVARKRRKDA